MAVPDEISTVGVACALSGRHLPARPPDGIPVEYRASHFNAVDLFDRLDRQLSDPMVRGGRQVDLSYIIVGREDIVNACLRSLPRLIFIDSPGFVPLDLWSNVSSPLPETFKNACDATPSGNPFQISNQGPAPGGRELYLLIDLKTKPFSAQRDLHLLELVPSGHPGKQFL